MNWFKRIWNFDFIDYDYKEITMYRRPKKTIRERIRSFLGLDFLATICDYAKYHNDTYYKGVGNLGATQNKAKSKKGKLKNLIQKIRDKVFG